MIDFTNIEKYKENNRIEAKKAIGGLPRSIWETYSAFANTLGGIILLGVEEHADKSLHPVDLPDPEKLIKDFWDIVNNANKVSANILSDKDVTIEDIGGKRIVAIRVPRAQRSDKPVYIDGNPLSGSYRRNGEGDYKCTKEEVQAMMRDAAIKTQDMIVLENMELDAFDYDSVKRYRIRMKTYRPGHVWEELEDVEFLYKLGAVGRSSDGKMHPTAAGLLMFGYEYEIVKEFPAYFLDYQEQFDPNTRWTDRKLALSSQKDKCNVVLIEEPENHLSYSNMSKLIDDIVDLSTDTQVIISTHSTYVLNKLSLKRVVLLQNGITMSFSDLADDTVEYFEKMPGYDTLRLILSKRVFLVEGPSDELIIQKLYRQKHGKLPIENGVDIISVRGTSFARFLEIAKILNTEVLIIPDNDGKASSRLTKYSAFTSSTIKLAMSNDDALFTLEKILIHCNGRDKLNKILGKKYATDEELFDYMSDNKADCALAIFKSDETISYIDEVQNAL